jgi:hypothetical protein
MRSSLCYCSWHIHTCSSIVLELLSTHLVGGGGGGGSGDDDGDDDDDDDGDDEFLIPVFWDDALLSYLCNSRRFKVTYCLACFQVSAAVPRRRSLFWDFTQCGFVVFCRIFGTSFGKPLPLKMEPIGCPETSLTNLHCLKSLTYCCHSQWSSGQVLGIFLIHLPH